MKLVGLMLARNEDWVIGLSARAALMWCDALVVLLHNCTDETEALVFEAANETDVDLGPHPVLGHLYNRRILVHCEYSQDWEEMRLRQTALSIARQADATHIAVIDADEVLTGNLLPKIRRHVEQTPVGSVLWLPWLQMVMRNITPSFSVANVMSSGMWANQNSIVAFPDDPVYCWKAKDGYDHHHRGPMGAPWNSYHPINDREPGVMHLQFLSRRRLIAKQFLYQLTERKRWGFDQETIKRRYVPTVLEADAAQLSPVPDSWWAAPYSHLLQYLHIDREPWQEKECLRLIAENPGIENGLDDFGLLADKGVRAER